MSGGEQQRVALARALVTRPVLLLADEPTGNLDNQTGERIILLLEALQAKYELTSLIVTHSPLLASRCNRQSRLAGGRAMVTDNGSGRPERSGQMPDGEVPGSLPGEPGGVRPLMSGWEGLGANFAARG
jgi:ABC-type transport system involved in cytochrome bd biosynthesis fused ATPase/permease subunit